MAFAKNTTKLSFAPDGTLVSMNGETTAPAEAASAAFMQSGDALIDFATKRRQLVTDLANANTATEKAAIQKQLDLLELNQQLATAKAGVGPERQAQLDTLNFQIEQAQKQIDLLTLQAKLQALQPAAQ